MRGRTGLALLLVLWSGIGRGEVYRCTDNGRTVYTDRPCAAGAAPVQIRPPAAVVAPAAGSDDLARRYDERRQRELKARSQSDAEWLKAHEARRADEARIRKAIVEGRVVAGMTPAQVRQVWGAPSSVDGEVSAGASRERWTWREGSRRRSVSFVDGRVASASDRSGGGEKNKR